MIKIISLFQRNYESDHLVRDEHVPGAEWVANGEGHPTIKWDGTACRVKGGRLYKRYDAKHGKTPPDFEPAQEADSVTGHWPGWVPIGDGPDDKWFRSATVPKDDGTYELIGPKINGNPHDLTEHILMPHGSGHLEEPPPRTFDGIREWFAKWPQYEGIVWHHLDGRMVKIKRRDFGYRWPKG